MAAVPSLVPLHYFTGVVYQWSRHLWIHGLVLLLALFSLCLCWNYFFDSYYIYAKFHERYIKPYFLERNVDTVQAALDVMTRKNEDYQIALQQKENSMSAEGEQMVGASFVLGPGGPLLHSGKHGKGNKQAQEIVKKMAPDSWVNGWDIVAAISNVFQLAGCLIALVDPAREISSASAFIGFGCFFAWVNILRYLQYDMGYFFMFSAIFRSFSTVIRYLLGTMTVFFGYAFLGSSVFWQSHRFESASRAIHIQYALLVGDSIYDTFADLTRIDFVFGQVFLYTFIILFICVVQNLIASIIQKVYSEDRKVEVRTIIEKERKALLEAEQRAEAEKHRPIPQEEEKAPVPALRLKDQVQDVF
ncbi:MAG: hypothetical protein P4L10_09185 [Acidobacteriaceae bacterium]|nr:hypothetical protein [Acidobacteriaceae bacterium]